jgi:hypothetical protein
LKLQGCKCKHVTVGCISLCGNTSFLSCPSVQDSTNIACQGELAKVVFVLSVLEHEAGAELCIMCHRVQMVSTCENTVQWMKYVHLLSFCKVCSTEKL